MTSALLRRSGIAAVHIAKLLEWQPKSVFQAGVGLNWKEIECMQEVWPELVFVGIEPNPHLFKKLKGKYPGITYQCALGDKRTIAELTYRSRHKDGGSLNPLHEVDTGEINQQIEVRVETLDKLFPSVKFTYNQPILLWLDVEGFELKVLRGGETFMDSVDMINVEMTGKPAGDNWCKPWEVHRWLVDHRFVLQYIHTFRSHSGQYDAVYVRPEMFKLEYSNSPCRCADCGG